MRLVNHFSITDNGSSAGTCRCCHVRWSRVPPLKKTRMGRAGDHVCCHVCCSGYDMVLWCCRASATSTPCAPPAIRHWQTAPATLVSATQSWQHCTGVCAARGRRFVVPRRVILQFNPVNAAGQHFAFSDMWCAGFIQLVLPVFHIGYFKQTMVLLHCICKNCSRVRGHTSPASRLQIRTKSKPEAETTTALASARVRADACTS